MFFERVFLQASVLHIGIANSHFKQNFIIVSIYTLGFGNIRIFSFSREHFAYRRLAPKIYFIVEKKRVAQWKVVSFVICVLTIIFFNLSDKELILRISRYATNDL